MSETINLLKKAVEGLKGQQANLEIQLNEDLSALENKRDQLENIVNRITDLENSIKKLEGKADETKSKKSKR